jgi:peroxiredoxin
MRSFRENIGKLEAADTQVSGVSMDSPFANKAFADQTGVTFPLLSDIGGKVSAEYGVYKGYDKFNTKIPAARRPTYLIDTNGKVVAAALREKEQSRAKRVADRYRGHRRPRCLRARVAEHVAIAAISK